MVLQDLIWVRGGWGIEAIRSTSEQVSLEISFSLYLQADTTFIMPRIWSAFVLSFQPFVQTDVANITVKRFVFVYTENKTKKKQCTLVIGKENPYIYCINAMYANELEQRVVYSHEFYKSIKTACCNTRCVQYV